MIRSLETLRTSLGEQGRSKIAVAVAQDAEVLLAVNAAYNLGLASAVLVGDEAEIRAIAEKLNIDLTNYEILHEADKNEACRKAVKLVRDKDADVVIWTADPIKSVGAEAMVTIVDGKVAYQQ